MVWLQKRRRSAGRWQPMLAVLAVAAASALAGCKTTTTVTSTSDSAHTSGASAEGDPPRRAAVRLQLAGGYYQKGQVDVAIKEATEATRIYPRFSSAFGLLGVIYMVLGEKEKAVDKFLRALQEDSSDPELNSNY